MQCNSTNLSNEQPPEPATRPHRVGLVEEWPRRASSLKADQDQGEVVSNSESQAIVTFSEFSTLRVYDDLDDHYRKTKAYSKKDYEAFGAQAMKEAHRLRQLIYRSPPASLKESVKYVLRNNIITSDELVGLDHLVLGKRCGVMKVRRDHMTAVLWKQLEQRRRREYHQVQKVEEDSLIDLLGKCAEKSSLKSTQSAIARATLSFSD